MALAWSGGTVMNKTETSLQGVFILEPRVFGDARGFFLESYNQRTMAELGIREQFVQDNHSFSQRNVLRGLHYQVKHRQGKLVRVAGGGNLQIPPAFPKRFRRYCQRGGDQTSAGNKRKA